ncbi:hypothetical protein ACFRAQ_34890 [Nocardia sp. NPDC056611]|uniref:hypothetical protein n=1 Tax=Nocardia sp. NPDC056611 TaxID=3345877 RepID=UPI0036735CFD
MLDHVRTQVFPGNGLSRPTDEQWALADSIVGRELDRFWTRDDPWRPHLFAPKWHNLSWLRSQVNRHLARRTSAEINKILDRIGSKVA